MPLKPAVAVTEQEQKAALDYTPHVQTAKSYGETKDARILYQGLTQAALQSMPLGQFATDVESHLKNVMATVDALAVFILERSK